MVDTLWLIIGVLVTLAETPDRDGLMGVLSAYFPSGVKRLKKRWVDGGYRGYVCCAGDVSEAHLAGEALERRSAERTQQLGIAQTQPVAPPEAPLAERDQQQRLHLGRLRRRFFHRRLLIRLRADDLGRFAIIDIGADIYPA